MIGRPRLYDATDVAGSASGALFELAIEGDCLLCNRPRDLDPTRGGCKCVAVAVELEEREIADRIRRALSWRSDLEAERREAFWHSARIVAAALLFALGFVLLAVL